MKLKPLKIKDVKPESFHNKFSYDAAIYAIELCNEMIERHNLGHIIIADDQVVKPEFKLNFYRTHRLYELVLRDSEHCFTVIVGDTHHEASGLIYCTKRSIRTYFKNWYVAQVVKSTKVVDL